MSEVEFGLKTLFVRGSQLVTCSRVTIIITITKVLI